VLGRGRATHEVGAMTKQRSHLLQSSVILCGLLVLLLPFGLACAPTPPLEAAFSADPTSGTAPLQVQFTDESSGEVTSWDWDFNNDGTTDSTDQNPSYVYETPGSYTVLLKVTGLGGSDTRTRSDYILTTEKTVIKIGVLAAFTGPTASAMQSTIQSMEDYLTKVVPGKDPLPEVEVQFAHFDTRLDYARIVTGYLSLLAQGVDMMVIPNAVDREILGDRFAEDQMPSVNFQGLETQLTDEWMVNNQSTVQSQGEVAMQWIMDTWDYETEGVPKVGHLGSTLSSSEYYQQGIDRVIAANPGKFTWVGTERGLVGQLVWTSEINSLESCDYIIVSGVGPMAASFVIQARGRGYEGAFVSGSEAFPGSWDLVTAATPASQLYDCYYVAWWPWWNEDVAFIGDVREYVQTYHPGEAEAMMKGSSAISGWALGLVIEDGIRRAIDKVGADDINGAALQQALAEINMDIEGYGDPWKVTSNNCLAWAQRAFEWKIDESNWEPISGWYLPISKPSD
jgi:PKD repeat protein